MKFAFCLTTYFPYGGLQRDFLRMAVAATARGHQIEAYTTDWRGEIPAGLKVNVLPTRGWTNHARTCSLAASLTEQVKKNAFDAVVGFNKMPGLDLYFAADPCFAQRVSQKSAWYRLTGRCRTYLRMEAAVFGIESRTRILSISEPQAVLYRRHYGTPRDRFFPLPPGVAPDRALGADRHAVRRRRRKELSIRGNEQMVLLVGSNYRLKGVDRAIRAMASLPRTLRDHTTLVIAGRGRSGPFIRLARKNKVEQRVRFLGERDDVPELLAAADLLLHPAYEENTGTVLIEALAAELPVLVTEVCGYSAYIREAAAGEIVPSPFRQQVLDRLLAAMLSSPDRDRWRRNARRYVARTDIFALSETAVDFIEQVARWLSCPNHG